MKPCQTLDQRDAMALAGRYRHPLVRDLAWLCLAPDLLALSRPRQARLEKLAPTRPGGPTLERLALSPPSLEALTLSCPGRPSLEELGLGDGDRLAAWLDGWEAAPQALEATLGDPRGLRLGLYHERFWQFLLARAPGTELIAHNLAIHRQGRTLGELDLLYRRRGDPRPVHLEVAIKFYLGLPEGPGGETHQARWVGPGCVDSLASKREHLVRHQLPMVTRPEARETLTAWLGEAAGKLQQRLAMPGVLFYPWHHPLPPPEEATPAHLRGLWLPWRAWPALRETLAAGTLASRLHKPHWMALPGPDQMVPLPALEAPLATHFARPAVMPQPLVLYHQGTWQRLFIVGDDWPRKLPLPPFPR
ncbi:DUF1853 family protein [Halomonas salifodinae]|uniref:DUF1853 family protein n=1 Tax=Halomonas salifodinae TaxID=438745 RepID=A0ABW2EYK3_9GAMM